MDIKDVVKREKDFHEDYYKRAFLSHCNFNFQVPPVWIDKAKNPTQKPLDYWEYAFYLLGNLEGKNIVEIGCGDGWITTCLASAGANVFALDVSLNACILTREKLKAHGLSASVVSVMDAHSMAFANNKFDAVFIAGVLHHLNISQVSNEFYRILKNGGLVVCYEPLKYGPVMWTIRQIWLRLNGMKEYNSTEDEDPLEEKDFEPLNDIFRKAHRRRFNFIAKTNRLRNRFGHLASFLRWIDYLILSLFPFLRRYCTCIVCRYEK